MNAIKIMTVGLFVLTFCLLIFPTQVKANEACYIIWDCYDHPGTCFAVGPYAYIGREFPTPGVDCFYFACYVDCLYV